MPFEEGTETRHTMLKSSSILSAVPSNPNVLPSRIIIANLWKGTQCPNRWQCIYHLNFVCLELRLIKLVQRRICYNGDFIRSEKKPHQPRGQNVIWVGRPQLESKRRLLIGPSFALRVHNRIIFQYCVAALPLRWRPSDFNAWSSINY